MRVQKLVAYGASIAMTAALLAGCSNSSTSVPSLSSGPSNQVQTNGPLALGHGQMTPLKLLELQLKGKVAAPITHRMLEREVKYFKNHPHQNLRVHRNAGGTYVWTDDYYYDYLLGLSKKGALISDTSTSANGGYGPVGLKTDANGNIWVGNSYTENSSFEEIGNAQEYSSAGAFTANYNWQECPDAGYTYCFDEGGDVAVTPTNVYASALEVFDEYYNSSNQFEDTVGSGITKMTNGSPTLPSTFYTFSNSRTGTNCVSEYFSKYFQEEYCDYVLYMDADASGNIWFSFNGYTLNSSGFVTEGAGVGELTSTGTFNIVLPSGTFGFAGGVNVTGKAKTGQTLSVLDQDSRTVYQYHLPLTSSSVPFNTIGPTQQNLEGLGDPISGGVSKKGSVVYGDAGGWVDSCSPTCGTISNIDLYEGAYGATYP